jgi:hypothetical protein
MMANDEAISSNPRKD